MANRSPNPRLAKIHRSYHIDEVARALGVHRNTIRNWIKRGLPTCGGLGQTLILGRELRAFLETRRSGAKRPCGPGRLYCFRCRAPRPPAGGMLDYRPITAMSGNLNGLCGVCGCLMFRRVSRANIDRVRGEFEVTFVEAERHIGESG